MQYYIHLHQPRKESLRVKIATLDLQEILLYFTFRGLQACLGEILRRITHDELLVFAIEIRLTSQKECK